jgi:hypothetical protein
MKRANMQAMKNASREVIAHFTKTYVTLLWFVALGLFAAYALWVRSAFLTEPVPAPIPVNGAIVAAGRVVDVWGLVVLGGGLAFILTVMCAVTYAIIVNRGAALWIERGRLVYVYRRALDAPLAEVAFVGLTDVPIYYGILRRPHKSCLTVRLKSGKEARLPTHYLENTDEVIVRLRQRIGLPIA